MGNDHAGAFHARFDDGELFGGGGRRGGGEERVGEKNQVISQYRSEIDWEHGTIVDDSVSGLQCVKNCGASTLEPQLGALASLSR